MTYIGSNLKHFRKKQGLNQTEMAAKFGLPRGTYVGYESDRTNPNPETLVMMTDYYSVNIRKFIMEDLFAPKNILNEPSAIYVIQDLKKITNSLLENMDESVIIKRLIHELESDIASKSMKIKSLKNLLGNQQSIINTQNELINNLQKALVTKPT